VERLQKIPDFQCQKPPGAFYAFVNIEQALTDTYCDVEEWAGALLEKEHVAVIPGSAFGFPLNQIAKNCHCKIYFSTI
jgi:aspartate aminotransferase